MQPRAFGLLVGNLTLLVVFGGDLTAAPLKMVAVEAPAINCVFSPDCVLMPEDSVAYVALPFSGGMARLQSRVVAGQPRSPAESQYGYLYRIDLGALRPVLDRSGRQTNCVLQVALPFGTMVTKDFDGDGSTDDAVFYVASGALGTIQPTAAEQLGEWVILQFEDPPLGPPDSSVFIGLVSTEPPRPAIAELVDAATGVGTGCEVQVPSLPAGQEPQLAIAPGTGYAGGRLAISGRAPPNSARVRISWEQGGNTRLIASGPVHPGGDFAFMVKVPSDAVPGSAQVRASSDGATLAEGASAEFTVEPTPPGGLRGRVLTASGQPLASATVQISDVAGFPLGQAQTDAGGNYSFADLAPGNYQVQAVNGGFFFPPKTQTVSAGGVASGNMQAVVPANIPAPIVVSFVGAIAVPIPGSAYDGSYPVLISDQSSAKNGGPLVLLPSLPAAAGSLSIRFWADIQQPAAGNDVSVEFRLTDVANKVLWSVKKDSLQPVYPLEPALNFPAYTSSIFILDINAHSLPPGDLTLAVTPFLNGEAGLGKLYTVRMVDLAGRWLNPWVEPVPDPASGRPVRVIASTGGLHYLFRARLPTSGFLPFGPSFTIPVFNKTLENNLNATLPEFQETFIARPSKGLYPGVLKPRLNPVVKLFSKTILNQSHAYQPWLNSNGTVTEYDLPRFTAMGPAQLLNVLLYQQGPGIGCFNACLVGCQVCAGWKVYADLTVDGKVELQSHLDSRLRLTGDIIPSVSGTIGGHVRVRLVLCKADGNITGTVGVQLPVHFQNSPPNAFFDQPCVTLSGHIDASIGCLGIGLGGGGSIGPYNLYGCDTALAVQATAAWEPLDAGDPAAQHDPAPDVAANSLGQALAVWVHNEMTMDGQPAPYVYTSFYDGASWSAGTRLTTDPAWVHEPKVAFLSETQAIAVWVQNTQPLEDILALGAAEFAYQEIYFSTWDGTRWSPGRPLTVNTVVDGVPALASDLATGQAIAAWTTVIEPSGEHPDLTILNHSAIFSGGSWGTAGAVAAPPSPAIDSEIQAAYDPNGNAWATWARDTDGDLTTYADRQILVARRGRLFWGAAESIPDLPPGAFAPSLALDADSQPVVAFLEPPSFQGELTSGTGNRSRLWTALNRSGSWTVEPVGSELYAEEPLVRVNPDNQAVIVFRRFSPEDLLHRDGDVGAAVASLNLPAVQWRDDYLSFDNQTNWKIAFAVAPETGRNFILNVKQSAVSDTLSPVARLTTQRLSRHHLRLQDTGPNAPYVAQMIVESRPDLVIAGDLAFSNPHPVAGQTVTISATLRNQGVAPVPQETPVQVAFYDQDGTVGPPLATRVYTNGLALGETVTLSMDYPVASPGLRVITARADAAEAVPESIEDNNTSAGLLGQMPPPNDLLAVGDSAAAAILLEWSGPDTAGLDHYDIWRSDDAGMTFEALGRTVDPTFVDSLALPGIDYVYAVSAVDLAGVASPRQPIASATLTAPTDVPEPELLAERLATELLLGWPKLAAGFLLEEAADLGPDTQRWTTVNAPPVILGEQQQVQLPIASATRFYRLHKP